MGRHVFSCRSLLLSTIVLNDSMAWDSQAECSNGTASLYICTYEGFPMMFSYKVYI